MRNLYLCQLCLLSAAIGCTSSPAPGQGRPAPTQGGEPSARPQRAAQIVPQSEDLPGVHELTLEEAAVGLLSGDDDIWGLVPTDWMEPILAACQAYHVNETVPDEVDELWPFIFTWPAADPEATAIQTWIEGPVVTGSPIAWSTALQNGLSAGVYPDSGYLVQEQSSNIDGILSQASIEQTLHADYLHSPTNPGRPRISTAPVSLPDPLSEAGFRGIGAYASASVLADDARRYMAREALTSLLILAVDRTGEVPESWENAQAQSGLVSIHLDAEDPEESDLAIWWDGASSYRFRVSYSGNLVEEGILQFTGTDPFASVAEYVSFEAAGRETLEFTELMGAWTLGSPDPVEQP